MWNDTILKNIFHFAILICILLPLYLKAEDFPESPEQNYTNQIEQAIKVFEQQLIEKILAFRQPKDLNSVEWIKAKLDHMVEVDQFMRDFSMEYPGKHLPETWRSKFQQAFSRFYKSIDNEHTELLKEMLAVHSWFTVSKFGEKADKDGWLLVQHADLEPDFQSEVLNRLEKLLDKKETNPTNFAYLFDRVASSWHDKSKRTKQRYGTQGMCTGPGTWEPLPMETPEKIDERRKSVGLGTMEEYKAMFKTICQ